MNNLYKGVGQFQIRLPSKEKDEQENTLAEYFLCISLIFRRFPKPPPKRWQSSAQPTLLGEKAGTSFLLPFTASVKTWGQLLDAKTGPLTSQGNQSYG
ncbi:hypothetical protein Z948_1193 [Sulfitobacter donghicola DSW-25 = KCTC 12864 = JCM 14565]|uniref:Uncharacterized protein n=1 Tax=Sulfitobacter donghicola DSW-25 = KCTC 12864 = JCM 14565 TaxID=1300350 RepID=A0A073II21_9RHOB|nr:hypothetical protein [Sulfitobacter donghicola]KEJ89146.1 hypothetical protein DSW25_12055 [Sulfitobacter donghicola DSW-25 = KCTC 12864 = JCM 14565]KIN67478.1 hypothetical protein Z948_1193 [Sulfitobacter donghicola DSW-25 = KCTC 12864 = JCM 14565]